MSAKALLIVARDVEGDLLASLATNKLRGGFKVAAVATGDGISSVLENVARFTGCFVVNRRLGVSLSNINTAMLGTAKMVRIEKSRTTIFGGGGKEIERVEAMATEVSLSTSTQSTVAQEAALRSWLIARMNETTGAPRPKAEMRSAATTEGRLKFSNRAFERSWRAAILATGATAWSAPGRKSMRRIDTGI